MPSVQDMVDDVVGEVLPSRKKSNWQRLMKDVSKQSVAKQVAIGATGGWCSGYVCGRVGKAAAAAVGGSLLLVQLAHSQGYIQVNWKKVESSVGKASKQFNRHNKDWESLSKQVQDFVAKNMFLAGGFAAGFLLGLAS